MTCNLSPRFPRGSTARRGDSALSRTARTWSFVPDAFHVDSIRDLCPVASSTYMSNVQSNRELEETGFEGSLGFPQLLRGHHQSQTTSLVPFALGPSSSHDLNTFKLPARVVCLPPRQIAHPDLLRGGQRGIKTLLAFAQSFAQSLLPRPYIADWSGPATKLQNYKIRLSSFFDHKFHHCCVTKLWLLSCTTDLFFFFLLHTSYCIDFIIIRQYRHL